MGPVARFGERRGAHKILLGKLEGKRPLGRPRHRWENNIKMDLKSFWWAWIRLMRRSIGTGGGLL